MAIPEVELKLLSIVRSRENFDKYKSILTPSFFTRESTKTLFNTISHYLSNYKGDIVKLRNLRLLVKSSSDNPDTIKECLNSIRILKRLRIEDEELIYDTVITFVQKQATKQLLLEVIPLMDGKRVDLLEIREKLDNIVTLDKRLIEKQTEFFDYEVGEIGKTKSATQVVPTMLGELDNYIDEGLGRGELGVILAPPGRGKTLTLINLGAKALLQGFKVLHFTLEISDRKVARRYDARLTGTPLGGAKSDRLRPLGRIKKIIKGKLIIKDYIDSAPTIAELKSFTSKILISKFNKRVDLMIVDYADLLAPERRFSERRFELTELYSALRRLGNEFNCAVWSASQSTRKSIRKPKISLEDFAEDIQKAAISDIVLSLCQTPEEEKERIMRIFLAKNRRGSGKPVLRFRIDPDRMTLSPFIL